MGQNCREISRQKKNSGKSSTSKNSLKNKECQKNSSKNSKCRKNAAKYSGYREIENGENLIKTNQNVKKFLEKNIASRFLEKVRRSKTS